MDKDYCLVKLPEMFCTFRPKPHTQADDMFQHVYQSSEKNLSFSFCVLFTNLLV